MAIPVTQAKTFRSVVITRRGTREGLQIIAQDYHAPPTGEARIRVLATAVHQDDIAGWIGNRPFLPKLPFVPGYDILGVVDAVGDGVTAVAIGDRVAALTVVGGHAEYAYLRAERLVRVPAALDPAEAVTLILNYLVAYQMLHRIVKVKVGDRVLIIGASGGVGTAFLQLGRLAGLSMYGTASGKKHGVLVELGAIPIDYHTQDFVDMIHRAAPKGLDCVFNGMGEDYIARGLRVLRRGGTLVHYGAPQSLPRFARLLVEIALFGVLPNGKSVKGYASRRIAQELRLEDWAVLFRLLEEGKIRPIIAKRFRLVDEVAQAYELLESGEVGGTVVMVAPERNTNA